MKLGTRKVYILAYVDDVAIIAENVKQMKELMAKVEKYFIIWI